MTAQLPRLQTIPAGCELVQFGRHAYVCDPAAALAKGGHAAVWGVPRRDELPPGLEPFRLAVVGVYRPGPHDALLGLVRLAHWSGRRLGWEETAYPVPPNTAARVVGVLVPKPGSRRLPRNVEIERFLARPLRDTDRSH